MSLMHELGKQAATKRITSSRKRVPINQAAEAIRADPPANAQGHLPPQYGVRVKRPSTSRTPWK